MENQASETDFNPIEDMTAIASDKLPDVIRAAYRLSEVKGLGFLHHKEGELPDLELAHKLEWAEEKRTRAAERKLDTFYLVQMDYVLGRAVKFSVLSHYGVLYVPAERWYDHTKEQLRELLTAVGADSSRAY